MNAFQPTRNPNASRGAVSAYNPTNAQGGVTTWDLGGRSGFTSAGRMSASGNAAITQFNQERNGWDAIRQAPANYGGGGGGGGSGSAPENPFLRLMANRDQAKAALEVENQIQAIADGKESTRAAASALANLNGRATGGGVFSRLRKGRGLVLGSLTGGLAAANRKKLMDAKNKAVDVGYDTEYKTRAGSNLGGNLKGVKPAGGWTGTINGFSGQQMAG